MKYYFQPMWVTKKTVVLRNGREIRKQIFDRQTITKSGRITNHVACIKYKGSIYKVDRIGSSYKYRQKAKI